jgi:hypothetical protein
MSRRSLLWFFLCAALAASCSSIKKSEPEPDWQSTLVHAPSDRVLWKLVLQALQRMDYPLGAGMDPGGMRVESGWKLDLHPFSRKGQRTMAVLQMKPEERGSWKVEARVKRQTNKELARPLDPRYADWVWEPDDIDEARVILQHVRSALDDGRDLTAPESGARPSTAGGKQP